MTPLYVRCSIYAAIPLTLLCTWIMALWAQSSQVPIAGILREMHEPRVEVAFYCIFVPALFGLCAVFYGLAGLMVTYDHHFLVGRVTSFGFVCGGMVAMGFLWGALFLHAGANPIAWITDHDRVPFCFVLGQFALAIFLIRMRMNDRYEPGRWKGPVIVVD
jgi:hypothetical protein